ncbi:MAG TPA: hypothetical protein DC013_04440 [Ruminococcaceae bacterium]|jgi:polar amino acid transport system substrate-binding protein|nr:hypothetical protein [Oscillospiraceae bacterium]
MKKSAFRNLIFTLTLAAAILLSGCSSNSPSAASSAAQPGDQSSASGEVRTIIAATKGTPHPYVSVDDSGKFSGYDIEVLKAAFDLLPQYKLELKLTDDMSSLLTGVTSGLYQVAVNNLSYSEERAKSYLYTFPYDKTSYVFVQKAGAKPITSLEEAAKNHYSIEVSTSGAIVSALEKWNSTHGKDEQINLVYSDAEAGMQHVDDGTTNFLIQDLAMYKTYQDEYHYNFQKTELNASDTELISSSDYTYFLVGLDDKQLRDDINGALKTLKENGTLTKLAQKYFGSDQAPEDSEFTKPVN